MSKHIARARESWLNDGNDEHFGDAALLCQGGDMSRCGDGKCRLDGFCFRGLGSAEVRRGIEARLTRIEAELNDLSQLVHAPHRRLPVAKMREEVREIRDNVLAFRAPTRPERASSLISERSERLRGPSQDVAVQALTPPDDIGQILSCDPAVYPELVE